MKSLIIFLQMVVVIFLWIPLILIGFFWGIMKIGFEAGKEKGEEYFEHLDKSSDRFKRVKKI